MKLYELTGEFRALEAAIDAGDVPEEAIADTIEALSGEVDMKIDSILSLVKEKKRHAEAIKAEVEALEKRRKQAERSAEWLIGYIERALDAMERDGYESARHKVTFRRSTALRITDEEALLEWVKANYPKAVIVKESVSKSAISELIDSVNIPHCVLETRKNIQIK